MTSQAGLSDEKGKVRASGEPGPVSDKDRPGWAASPLRMPGKQNVLLRMRSRHPTQCNCTIAHAQ